MGREVEVCVHACGKDPRLETRVRRHGFVDGRRRAARRSAQVIWSLTGCGGGVGHMQGPPLTAADDGGRQRRTRYWAMGQ